MNDKLTIVIPCKNERDNIYKCIAFIAKQKGIIGTRVIIADVSDDTESLMWLNRVYNKYRKWRNLPYQSISQKIKGGVKAATNYVNDYEVTALKMAEKEGCDGVICGHIHQPEDRIINGKRYLNCGDWVENMSAVCIDNMGKVYLYKK